MTCLLNLILLNLSTNQFTGVVPPLPASLGELNMTNNNLTQVSVQDMHKFPKTFSGNSHLCVENGSVCTAVSTPLAPTPTPEPGPNLGQDSGGTQLSCKNIVFIAVGIFLALLIIVGYGRYFCVTRFEKPGGEFYHYYHPEKLEVDTLHTSPSVSGRHR
jgi:hypothetical protein